MNKIFAHRKNVVTFQSVLAKAKLFSKMRLSNGFASISGVILVEIG